MPDFMLRIWAEQTLFDSNEYKVTAESLEAAVELLNEQQELADDRGRIHTHPAIQRHRHGVFYDEIVPLDPEEVVDGTAGVTLVHADGQRLRDLEGVPTCCVQLGEPLDADAAISIDTLRSRKLNTVLAALRLYEAWKEDGIAITISKSALGLLEHIETIATDGGKTTELTSQEINDLCERLNAG